MISKNSLQIQNEINQIKQFVKLIRDQKEKIVKYMHNYRIENQIKIKQLNNNLEQQVDRF
jgi:hypothetical protein